MKNLTELKRRPVEEVVVGILDASTQVSTEAGLKLINEAKEYGLSIRNFLTLAIDPRLGEHANMHIAEKYTGYEAAVAALGLPSHDDFDQGVLLQASADAFQRFPGSRALFPAVIDDMLMFKNRQDQIEKVEPLLAQSRTITGNELVMTSVLDDSADRGTFVIPELANIPTRTIRMSETSVKMYKHGSAIRTSYEFSRRASLDVLTPYAARVARELEISKVKMATSLLISGDGVNAAAPVSAITAYGGTINTLSTQYKALAKWLMSMAKAGTPVDTIVGNYDTYIELLFMFASTLSSDKSLIEKMSQPGFTPAVNLNIPLLNGAVNFALSSTMPANKLLGFNKAETLEELVESGSQISESEIAVKNQSVTYVQTETKGYTLKFGDTRSILDFSA